MNNIPDKTQNKIGVAVDVGTTTIGISCIDLLSHGEIISYAFLNPQSRFGADVITRIKHCVDEPDMLMILSDMLRSAIDKSLRRYLGGKYNNISKVCYSGNTTMLHILRGLSVDGLAAAPFKPVTLDYYEEERVLYEYDEALSDVVKRNIHEYVTYDEVHNNDENLTDNILQRNSGRTVTEMYLPGFSAFVGADILSGAEYLNMGCDKQYDLLIDLGTNGEMLLINQEKGFATSTACGPVFDHGVTGAVYGSESVHAIASSVRSGIIDKTGLIKGIFFEKGIELDKGFVIRQEHVRRFQMAKAAIYAGISCLMVKAGIDYDDIGHVYISGGLGFYLEANDAFITKMLPKEFRGRITVSGNTSLLGAQRFLMAEDNATDIAGDSCKDNAIDKCKSNAADISNDRNNVIDFASIKRNNDDINSDEFIIRSDMLDEYESMRSRTEAFELADYEKFQDIYIQAMNF